MVNNMIRLVCTPSGKSAPLNQLLTPHHITCKLIKRYSKHKGEGKEEMGKGRAPSTLEVMEQFSHEKEERISHAKTHQNFESQSSDNMINNDVKQTVGQDDNVDPKSVKKNKLSKHHDETP